MALSFAWMFGETKPGGLELLIEVDNRKIGRVREALTYYSIESGAALTISFIINLFVTTVFAKAFYGMEQANNIGLMNAGQYLQEKNLAAGQSSTITGTYSGQFIMGGFLNLSLKKWLRALITRNCAIIPTLIVALVFDTSEDSLDVLNEWLNVLQSIQIPFALIPLLCLVSQEEVMGIFKIVHRGACFLLISLEIVCGICVVKIHIIFILYSYNVYIYIYNIYIYYIYIYNIYIYIYIYN
ncbi:hypothetical protein Pfo_019378 [Paulownia fortunei]|nr:hypothetical protein Pfo_019378 [Paulownia fortunei]